MLEIIWMELISRHYDDLLEGYFGIEKTQELYKSRSTSKLLAELL